MTDDASTGWPLLSRLTREVRATDPELAEHMAQAIRAELDFYRASRAVPLAAIVQSAAEHIEAVASVGEPAETRDAPARRLGEVRARDGVSLADVTDSLRVGTRYLWDRIVAQARTSGAATDAELVDLATEMWVMHGEYVQAMTAGYRKESAQVLLGRQQERLGLVYGLLTARGASSPWDAVDRLGLPRQGGFVVVGARSETLGRMPLPRVEADLAEAGVLSAWVMVGSTQLGVVSAVHEDWRQRLSAISAACGATAGVSPVETEYGRIGHAVRLARTALAAAGPGELCFFDDSPVPVAAAGSPEVSGPVVDAVLGRLLAAPETEQSVLLETLTHWFASDGTVADVATRAWVHQNTVRNRLRRVTALTGRDVAHPREAAELYLALTAYLQVPTAPEGLA